MTPTVRIPRSRSRLPVVCAMRALWTWPTNILGHTAGFLVSRRRPTRVRGRAAIGWLYPIRPGLGLGWVGAVTLGHAILHRPDAFRGRIGRLVLAHELAHTRQHDLLGPFYLPLHAAAQLISAVLSLRRLRPHTSRVHDDNPLEEKWICLGVSAIPELADDGERSPPVDSLLAEALLEALGA